MFPFQLLFYGEGMLILPADSVLEAVLRGLDGSHLLMSPFLFQPDTVVIHMPLLPLLAEWQFDG